MREPRHSCWQQVMNSTMEPCAADLLVHQLSRDFLVLKTLPGTSCGDLWCQQHSTNLQQWRCKLQSHICIISVSSLYHQHSYTQVWWPAGCDGTAAVADPKDGLRRVLECCWEGASATIIVMHAGMHTLKLSFGGASRLWWHRRCSGRWRQPAACLGVLGGRARLRAPPSCTPRMRLPSCGQPMQPLPPLLAPASLLSRAVESV